MAKSILVADDAAFMRAMMIETLNKHGYDQITEAEDGVKALKAFVAGKPDLVIMDLTMPNMDGLEACKAMREIDPDVPVILSAVPEFTDEAFKAGARDFLEKPFTPNRLMETVKCALDDRPFIVPASRSLAKMVLIVDRSGSVKMMIRKYVNDVVHCEIAEAKDGKTAVELFRNYKPDAVFMEIQIPEINGLDACRQMMEIDAGVPVVILARQEYVQDGSIVDEAIRAGAKDFIVKPFREDRFKKTVKAILVR